MRGSWGNELVWLVRVRETEKVKEEERPADRISKRYLDE